MASEKQLAAIPPATPSNTASSPKPSCSPANPAGVSSGSSQTSPPNSTPPPPTNSPSSKPWPSAAGAPLRNRTFQADSPPKRTHPRLKLKKDGMIPLISMKTNKNSGNQIPIDPSTTPEQPPNDPPTTPDQPEPSANSAKRKADS